MLVLKREKFKKISQITGRIFSKTAITPNGYTVLTLFSVLLSVYFLVKSNFILAIVFFIFSEFLDFVDGSVARHSQQITKLGPYLDTICDRYVEAIILIGFLFLPFPKILFSHHVWISLALVGSLMTTYSKAAAKEKGLIKEELKGGLFEKGDRFVLILLTLIISPLSLGFAIYPIIVLAIVSNISALQRIFIVINSRSS